MGEEEKINPGHRKVLKVLRTAGPIFTGLGGLCMVIAFVDIVRVMMDMSDFPRLFWLFFVGIPLLFVGIVMIATGFSNKIARFQAAQFAPVAKDTFNYMAEGTQEGVKTIARSVVEGIHEASTGEPTASASLRCPACGFAETVDAAFCSQCGKPIQQA